MRCVHGMQAGISPGYAALNPGYIAYVATLLASSWQACLPLPARAWLGMGIMRVTCTASMPQGLVRIAYGTSHSMRNAPQ